MFFSIKDLRIFLRIFGFLVFISVLISPGLLFFLSKNFLITLLEAASFLVVGMVYLSISSGVHKKEKWAWVSALIFFNILIIGGIIGFLLNLTSLPYLIIEILVPILFIIYFIKTSKEFINKTGVGSFAFIITIIGLVLVFILFISSILYNKKSIDLYFEEWRKNIIESTIEKQEKIKESLDCQRDCFNKYIEAEKNIPEGWSPEFTKIQADFESCKDKCNKIIEQ